MQSFEPIAFEIANAILQGFNRHFSLFISQNKLAAAYFVKEQFAQAAKAAIAQIDFYDLRVNECQRYLEKKFNFTNVEDKLWRQVKLVYITLLYDHKQPELAESFYNSLFCRMFKRNYYQNSYIFVNAAINRDDIQVEQLDYRSYYPLHNSWQTEIVKLLEELPIKLAFENLERDATLIIQALAKITATLHYTPTVNMQIHVLTPLLYRNKGAYVVARIVDHNRVIPFILPIFISQQRLFVDGVVNDDSDLANIFSFTRAYFKVDFPIPSAVIRFLKTIVPNKAKSELYTSIGLHKQGKNEFYRDLLYHLRHSSDQFVVAQGIEGMVMHVFTLPSFPYVFKVIKDKFHINKNVSHEHVLQRYHMVKRWDRVGRMADTWDFSHVAFPLNRFTKDSLKMLQQTCANSLTIEDQRLIIRHLYIERRLVPLNIYLDKANQQERERIIIEYGNAIEEIATAGIFPGDLLLKNFGVTRFGRIVFYDYDEIIPLEQCNFRPIPQPQTYEQEMAAEPWYTVAENDIFPEEFGEFLITDPQLRQVFKHHHANLLDYKFWQQLKNNRINGILPDIYPYKQELRFQNTRI